MNRAELVEKNHPTLAVKLIYLALRNITKKWNRPPVTWKAAAGQFAIQFGDRFFSSAR